MKEVNFYDRSGNLIELVDWDGYLLTGRHQNFRDEIKKLPPRKYLDQFDFRKCKLLLCSYSRSGYHWMHHLVRMMMSKTLEHNDDLVENMTIDRGLFAQYHGTLDKTILHTHLPPEYLPETMLDKKMIYIYRNPKDIVCSLYALTQEGYKYPGSLGDFTDLFLQGKVDCGSWFDHVLKWDKLAQERDICLVSYENMWKDATIQLRRIVNYMDVDVDDDSIRDTKNPIRMALILKDPTTELRRIANYINMDVDDDFLQSVTETCNIDKMKRLKINNPRHRHVNIVRKGGIGGWKEHFSVQLNEEFDRVFMEKMKTSKLQFTF